jgi:hypothetical protein
LNKTLEALEPTPVATHFSGNCGFLRLPWLANPTLCHYVTLLLYLSITQLPGQSCDLGPCLLCIRCILWILCLISILSLFLLSLTTMGVDIFAAS